MLFVIGGLAVVARTKSLNDQTQKFVDTIHARVAPHHPVTSDEIAEAANEVFGVKNREFFCPH